ncbi:DUF4091 domain-containing protein [uncultured Sphaerochaeta sp.]|uniref:DUF4091 domain-containing protein n=1 Tax=uncultured Sphaerochaeta sp. TaxID=886478 RepID=UPI002A0A9317|nr:DUF4091 domain-containing protein [uncultured Sphaerochaeta sp.]
MNQYEFFLCSSLEKVFPDKRPTALVKDSFMAAIGDTFSFQLVYQLTNADNSCRFEYFDISLQTEAGESTFRDVELVPAQYLATEKRDRFYLSTTPGLFPDLLLPSKGRIRPMADQYRSLWITLPLQDCKSGTYSLTLNASKVVVDPDTNEEKQIANTFWRKTLHLTVLDQKLPALKLFHTEWFHVDCLCNYYHVQAWSEEHWQIVHNYIRFAAKECAINLLLTPIFTPPLDTSIGGERTTVQLVSISKKEDSYTFDFSKFRRWCAVCKEEGITSLEFAHFFTQWGAKKTPKILVEEDGKEKQLFGWHVAATDPAYRNFLEAFVPALLKEAQEAGFDRTHLFFHISDEPNDSNMDSYLAAKNQIADLLEGYQIMDALSSYEFYKKGCVQIPIPANDHIELFKENVRPLWTYYCIAQGNLVPNRFLALPSARNRIMGVLCYLYEISGFLHWGYNFYNDENSRNAINPFTTTDGNKAFPAGDPFLVYPGKDGQPLSSLRNEVQKEAFFDLRYLCMLESRIGREKVIELVKSEQNCSFTFTDYPRAPEYLLQLREKVLDRLIETSLDEKLLRIL